jgi:hypothetical protein
MFHHGGLAESDLPITGNSNLITFFTAIIVVA